MNTQQKALKIEEIEKEIQKGNEAKFIEFLVKNYQNLPPDFQRQLKLFLMEEGLEDLKNKKLDEARKKLAKMHAFLDETENELKKSEDQSNSQKASKDLP